MAPPVIGINDSRLGAVVREDVDEGCRVVLAGVAEVVVPLADRRATVRVAEREVELSRRRWLLLPNTFVAHGQLGDIGYRLAPRGLRLAEFLRAGRMLAVLARPHRGDRIVRWDEGAGPTDEELALGHALAVYAGF